MENCEVHVPSSGMIHLVRIDMPFFRLRNQRTRARGGRVIGGASVYGNDEQNCSLLPARPVQRILKIVSRLGNQDDTLSGLFQGNISAETQFLAKFGFIKQIALCLADAIEIHGLGCSIGGLFIVVLAAGDGGV